MNLIRLVCVACAMALAACGCAKDGQLPSDPRLADADVACRAKWGKGLSELPAIDLVAIGPQSESIFDEFRWAFSLHHAVQYGQRVNLVKRDAGGGGSSIETYLLNVYREGGNPEIDIVWGGGENPFVRLANGTPIKDVSPNQSVPLLEKLTLAPDVLSGMPAEMAGSRLYDKDMRWVGSALSGFGILYNAQMLRKCNIAPPQRWEDLADKRFAGLVELADPVQSGSAASAFRMIAMSADDWPAGWAKLLGVAANAREFSESAGTAANAPALGEALVATCIDFFGASRVAEAPDRLTYVSPRGQTVFTPDPIGILKDAPHRELAQQFVDFVLSPQGQALWALPAGAPGGPVRSTLGRQPIRHDTYELCEGRMLPWIVNPYEEGVAMAATGHAKVNFGVLRELLYAAAIANHDGLVQARKALAKSNDPALLAELRSLPENVATAAKMEATANDLKDAKKLDALRTGWRDFFRAKYRRIAG
jgi:ABC-type Fe3+ transport system substrate-binding protein